MKKTDQKNIPKKKLLIMNVMEMKKNYIKIGNLIRIIHGSFLKHLRRNGVLKKVEKKYKNLF